MGDKNKKNFTVDYAWSSWHSDGGWSQLKEYFTFPNYDKIFFSMHARTRPNFRVKIVKKGIFNPSRANITIWNGESFGSATIIDWKSNESSVILMKPLKADAINIYGPIYCTIELDAIDFEKEDLEILSSISGINYPNNYFLSPTLSDVIIKVKNNTEGLPAHKFILASHSCVFERMFETNMKEARDNCIRFDEFETDTITEMLRFLYTGQVEPDNDYNVLLELFACAQMYQIKNLSLFISYKLIQNLNVDNVVDILVKTDKLDVPKLHEKALLYLDCNKERISYFKALKELNNSKVLRTFFMTQMQMKIVEADEENDE